MTKHSPEITHQNAKKNKIKSPLIPFKLVYVEWEDSMGCQTEWMPLDGIKESPALCWSVGWLVYDGASHKVIAPHVAKTPDGNFQGCGDMSIPMRAIKKIDVLMGM